jgi:A/G-specific adenine glycosylase
LALISAPGFRRAILRWYDASRRDLPWRALPQSDKRLLFYGVWLSEIMLQQTRVETVVPYYLEFLRRFPSIESLAAAAEAGVLTAWSGLGYYSRARNLHRAARQIVAAGLPATHEQTLALAGVGPYTAAAIASIALNLPYAALDGNVIRVLSRLTNDASEITSGAARRNFAIQAAALLDPVRPGDFNQSMMELGATICVPRSPLCNACPVARFCAARSAGTATQLPVKLRKRTVRELALDLAILEKGDRLYLVKRRSTERRLADFWELPRKQDVPQLDLRRIGEFRHQIVNDLYRIFVWRVASGEGELPGLTHRLPDGSWIEFAKLSAIPLTTVTKKALAPLSLK